MPILKASWDYEWNTIPDFAEQVLKEINGYHYSGEPVKGLAS